MTMDASDPSSRIEALLAHREWVRRLALSLVGDESRASDLEQQVWLSALRAPPRYLAVPRGWLATALRHASRNLFRGERRRGRHEAAAARPEAKPDRPDLVAEASAQRHLVGAVLDLAEPYRTTVLRLPAGTHGVYLGRQPVGGFTVAPGKTADIEVLVGGETVVLEVDPDAGAAAGRCGDEAILVRTKAPHAVRWVKLQSGRGTVPDLPEGEYAVLFEDAALARVRVSGPVARIEAGTREVRVEGDGGERIAILPEGMPEFVRRIAGKECVSKHSVGRDGLRLTGLPFDAWDVIPKDDGRVIPVKAAADGETTVFVGSGAVPGGR